MRSIARIWSQMVGQTSGRSGQASLEWAGAVLLVAMILVVLSPGITAHFAVSVKCSVQKVLGDQGGCGLSAPDRPLEAVPVAHVSASRPAVPPGLAPGSVFTADVAAPCASQGNCAKCGVTALHDVDHLPKSCFQTGVIVKITRTTIKIVEKAVTGCVKGAVAGFVSYGVGKQVLAKIAIADAAKAAAIAEKLSPTARGITLIGSCVVGGVTSVAGL